MSQDCGGVGADGDKNTEWPLCLLRTALSCRESRFKKTATKGVRGANWF